MYQQAGAKRNTSGCAAVFLFTVYGLQTVVCKRAQAKLPQVSCFSFLCLRTPALPRTALLKPAESTAQAKQHKWLRCCLSVYSLRSTVYGLQTVVNQSAQAKLPQVSCFSFLTLLRPLCQSKKSQAAAAAVAVLLVFCLFARVRNSKSALCCYLLCFSTARAHTQARTHTSKNNCTVP